MGIIQIFFVALSLSMDAFAVSICEGLCMQKLNLRRAAAVAVLFAVFQMLMPVIGIILFRSFESYISHTDHWIAFVLLTLIGGKMIFESLKADKPDNVKSSGVRELLVLAVATSIDALAVGVTLPLFPVDVWLSVGIIGAVTLIMCFAGVMIGHRFGSKFRGKAELAGGIILILIGLKILLEHLGVFL